MNETELDNLVVRLTGDGSGYQNMLREAAAQTKQFTQTVSETFATIGGLIGAQNTTSAFGHLEEETVRLGSAIKSTGRDVEKTMAKYGEFVESMQRTSLQSRSSTISLLAQAEAMGMIGEEAEKAVRVASNLESLGRGSAQNALAALSVYQRTGNYFALAQFIPTLRRGRGIGMEQGKGGQEKHNEFVKSEVARVLGMGAETQTNLMATFNGQLKLLQNNLQGLREDLGQIVSKYVKPVIQFFNDAVKWVRGLNPEIKELVVVLGGLFIILSGAGPVMRFFALLARLATSISPMSGLIMGLAAATGIWVKSVGGISKAWDIAQRKIYEVYSLATSWLSQFLQTNQRLVLGMGLTATAIAGVVVSWKLLTGTIAVVDSVLTLFYIKQTLQKAALFAWQSALYGVETALAAVSLLISGAQWLGSLALSLTSLLLQKTALLAYNAVLIATTGLVFTYQFAVGLLAAASGALTASTTAGAIAMAFYNVVIALATLDFNLLTLTIFGCTAASAAFGVVTTIATAGLNLLVGAIVLAVFAMGGYLLAQVAVDGAISATIGLIGLMGSAIASLVGIIIGALTPVLAEVGVALGIITTAGGVAATVFGPLIALFGVALVTAFSASSEAINGFLDTLLTIPGKSGPLATVGSMFIEWYNILVDVYHAITLMPAAIRAINSPLKNTLGITTGLDLAWHIIRAGYDLMVAQIRGSWPSLWDFAVTVALGAWTLIQAGWTAFTAQLKVPFTKAFHELAYVIKKLFFDTLAAIADKIALGFAKLILANPDGFFVKQFRSAMHAMTDLRDSLKETSAEASRIHAVEDAFGYAGMADDMKKAKAAIDDLNAKIAEQKKIIADAASKGVILTDADKKAVDAARKRLDDLRGLLKAARAEEEKLEKKSSELNPGKGFERGEQEIKKWEAALVGSAEAATRIQEYYEKLSEGPGHVGSAPEFTKDPKEGLPEFVGPPAPSAPGGGGTGGMEAILEKIYVALTDKVGAYERRVRLSGVGKVGL